MTQRLLNLNLQMLNVQFFRKRSDFAYDFSRKMFLILHSINWPDLIIWLSLLLEILANACIAIVC